MLKRNTIFRCLMMVACFTFVGISIFSADAQDTTGTRTPLQGNIKRTGAVVQEVKTPTDTWAVILQRGANPDLVAQQTGFSNQGNIAGLPDTYLFNLPNSGRLLSLATNAMTALSRTPTVVSYQQQYAIQHIPYDANGQDTTPPPDGNTTTNIIPFNGDQALAQSYTVTLNGDFLSAGRGMRGQAAGVIRIAAIPDNATVSKVFMYWGTVGNAGTFTAPTINGHTVSGSLIGTSADTGTGAAHNYMYRGDVTAFVTGNGDYTIAGLPHATPATNDTQGASLIVIYSNANMPKRQITIRDGAVTLNTNGANYTASFTPTLDSPLTDAKIALAVGSGTYEGLGTFSEGVQTVNGQTIVTDPFEGNDGDSWDAPLYDISGLTLSSPITVTIGTTADDGSGVADKVVLGVVVLSNTTTGWTPPPNPVTDPLFRYQWHLRNIGQTGGTPGVDADVVPVWNQGINGTGVTIAVVDDGLDHSHPDLSPGYVAATSHDFNDNDSDPAPGPSDFHGTSVAGVAAGRDNSTCGVGAAYRANLSGLRLISAGTTDAQDASALDYMMNSNQIYSNSWGPGPEGFVLGGPGPLAAASIQNGATNGRNGLGNIYLWAAGNGLQAFDNVNADGFANDPYAMAIGAVDPNGKQTWYGEPGAAMFISAPSETFINWQNFEFFPPGPQLGITTTDRSGFGVGYDGYSSASNCTNQFGGTSSATPLVSGVVALMLQANPNLGYRDVQHILASTAVKNDPTDPGWLTNTAGYHTNDKYGFGLVDAAAAVNSARSWTNLPALQTISSPVQTVNTAIPDANASGVTSIYTTSNVPSNFIVERAVVVFTATHPFRGDIQVKLTAPSGVTSVIMSNRENDNGANYSSWPLETLRDWGERGNGTWTINVADLGVTDTGTFNSWQLVLYGYTQPTSSHGPDRIGVYNASNAVWLDRYNLTTSATSDNSFLYGGISGGIALAGDWNGDGIDSPGMYVPSTAYWFFRNTNDTGIGDITAVFGGIPGALPVVGDWDGNGTDTLGLYLPSTGQWLLKNTNATGTGDPDISFIFGPISGGVPIVGDWDGDGKDSVGLYVPATGLWVEHSTTAAAGTDTSFVYGGISGGIAITGDWDANGIDSPGMYVPNTSYWFFRNTNTTGLGDITMVYAGNPYSAPVVGHWSNSIVLLDNTPEPTAAPPTTTGQVIESDSDLVARTDGWTSTRDNQASGRSYLGSRNPADSLTLNFSGTQADIVYVGTPNGGSFDVSIDGQVAQTVSTDSQGLAYNSHVVISGLADGDHVLTITPHAGRTLIDAFVVAQALPVTVSTEEATAEATTELTEEATLPVTTEEVTAAPTEEVTAAPTDQATELVTPETTELPTAQTFPTLPPPASPTDLPTALAFPTLDVGGQTTEEVTPETTDEATQPSDLPTALPFPTLPSPATPTTAPTAAPLALPAVATMDDGATDWSHTQSWQLGQHDSGMAWSMTTTATALESLQWAEQIDLRNTPTGASLTFQSQFTGDGAATVQVSVDGSVWQAVAVVAPSDDWTTVTVDLSAFSDNTIQVAFVWQATGATVENDWGIDNVAITAGAPPTATAAPTLEPSATLAPTDAPVATDEVVSPAPTQDVTSEASS